MFSAYSAPGTCGRAILTHHLTLQAYHYRLTPFSQMSVATFSPTHERDSASGDSRVCVGLRGVPGLAIHVSPLLTPSLLRVPASSCLFAYQAHNYIRAHMRIEPYTLERTGTTTFCYNRQRVKCSVYQRC